MPTGRSHHPRRTRGKRFAVLDPATGAAFDEAPDQRPDELDAVVDRAHAAWLGRRADPVARTMALLAAADADVEVERIADRLFWAAFRNCGQVCMAVKRGYAPVRLHSEVVQALARRAKSVVVGPGLEAGSEPGPVNNSAHLARVEHCTAQALADGARAVAGGHRLDRPGCFFAPTILADVPPDSPVVVAEQLGPVLPVLPYGSLDEAVERANGTGFGLGGSVWGADLDRAEAVADRLVCGTAWINHDAELSVHRPDEAGR
ncbi:aldehyde dehydrogenase family protein [Streptomyces sp. S465]|uniref:aldehyde dehydrogenase family protein n=1 Tax=Streptomyces sp. S465 TaxID=2979468 RepID=UPI0022A82C6F|nr:aldehyde dehydrogenase family protein [Streptomyces sp. S465]WAP60309.1 aldehyde dehydrogenase family protein [Streptomyces sp. S465]